MTCGSRTRARPGRARSATSAAVMHEAGPRALRAGLPRRRGPHPGLRRAVARAPTSRSRGSGRTRSATRLAFWERLEPGHAAPVPGRDGRDRRRRCCTGPRAWCDPRSSAWRPTRSPTTCTSSCASRSSWRCCAGDLDVNDLPVAFSDGMERLLGIRPPTDAAGRDAGHPLGRRPVRLLPHLHPGQPVRGAARRGGRARSGADRGGRGGGALRSISSASCASGCTATARGTPPAELMRRATGRGAGLGRPREPPGALLRGGGTVRTGSPRTRDRRRQRREGAVALPPGWGGPRRPDGPRPAGRLAGPDRGAHDARLVAQRGGDDRRAHVSRSRNLSARLEMPPPRMIRSGQISLSTRSRYSSSSGAQSFTDSPRRSRAPADARSSASLPRISMWPSSVFGTSAPSMNRADADARCRA